ncbi:TPA: hypothetical protein N0F65_011645 [Lagenidium giganteum]|uniref:PX domain-containing protein n=1 Tax=Lagenidium giganteum TaxID=4803 RepID=A0AAV2ZAG4_9STRA|nr:TPA: hypothetical protein N0F65_011645 [Lagenidium giganteum]
MQPPSVMFQSGVQVFIPAALNRPTHTLYSVCMVVQPTAQEWTVNRRYSQFLQLKKDLLAELNARSGCPGCASFSRAIQKFPFPQKSLIRTNKVVRKRVTALQEFIQLLVERVFNDLPKCATCGERIKKIIRPFLLRGAQPLGSSTTSRIQQSLSLASYAIISRPVHQPVKTSYAGKSSADYSYTSTQRTDSDPSMELASPTDVSHSTARAESEDSYALNYGDERCHDAPVPLAEAVKNVVIAEGKPSTYEDMVFRLSTMWDAFENTDAMDCDDQRLSPTLEEDL